MKKKQVVVIGSGLMGAGIAQVNVETKHKTTLVDVSEEKVDTGVKSVHKGIEKKYSKGKLSTEDKDKALTCLFKSTDYNVIENADIIIEAITENLELKKEVLQTIESYKQEDALIMSNTSALSIASLGSVLKKPENFIGFHFFYPAPLFDLIEITPSIITNKQTIESAMEFAKEIAKTPVLCKDYPGFIVNRLLIPMVNEAAYLVMEGVNPEDVDVAMRLGANHKMGPLTLADFVGIDTLVATMEGLYNGFSDSKYRPCPLLIRMVEAGTWGRKTGVGFYTYDIEK